ncbi:MAG: LexA family transcriptional regulator [Treponema sp.]|jgi:SOS-response transcriptional repressor LexA|nr:LexA family transcriptional regulator [Treponema sp.]
MVNEAEKYTFLQERSGLSKKAFAESLGLSKEQGSMISRGKYRLSREVLKKMARLYNVDLNWLIAGGNGGSGGQETAQVCLIEQEAAAGRGKYIDENPGTRLLTVPRKLIAPHDPATLAAVYVSGDSMTGENINDGDVVIFKKTGPGGSGIYVVSLGDTLLVKRIELSGQKGHVVLLSANPAYPPRTVSGLDYEDFRIEGRVIACFHRF